MGFTDDLRQDIYDKIRSQTSIDSISQISVADIFTTIADLLDSINTTVEAEFREWTSTGAPFPVGSKCIRGDKFYQSLVNGNTSDPATDTSGKWKPLGDVLGFPIQVELGEGGAVGGYKTGDVIPSKTKHDTIFDTLFRKSVPIPYKSPTLQLTTTANVNNIEVGDTVVIPLLSLFTQNDAGSPTLRQFTKNGNFLANGDTYSDTIEANGTVVNYRSSVNYNQGPCKVNNMGQTDCNGRIEAGTIYSSILSILSFRKYFVGFGTVPTSSSAVRALPTNGFLKNKGQKITVNIPIGATRVIFCFDKSFGPITSIKYVELSGTEIKDIFSYSEISVYGSNDKFPAIYYMYVYTPVEPFPVAATYEFTV